MKIITDSLFFLFFQSEPRTKAEKIKLALEKLKEANVRKVNHHPCVCVCVCFLTSSLTDEGKPSLLPLLVDSQGADERRQLQDTDGGWETDGPRGFGHAVWEDTLWLQHRLEPVWDQPGAADGWDEHVSAVHTQTQTTCRQYVAHANGNPFAEAGDTVFSPDVFLIISERGFEDHEHLVELLSAWTRFTENKIYFVSRPQKYLMFTDPQASTGFLLSKGLQFNAESVNETMLYSLCRYFTCGKRRKNIWVGITSKSNSSYSRSVTLPYRITGHLYQVAVCHFTHWTWSTFI